ncbi:transposase, MuDR, MULE transposase domain protein [Tanacetum coccineum]
MHVDLTLQLFTRYADEEITTWEAYYPLNLSAKTSSFKDTFDITDDTKIRTFVNYLRPLLIIDVTHLKGQYKGTNLVDVGMIGNNQIVPIAFGICKGETGLCWSWWMSVLKECIGDNPNLLFISDRHPSIALAVQNEFPLAFHVFVVSSSDDEPIFEKKTKCLFSLMHTTSFVKLKYRVKLDESYVQWCKTGTSNEETSQVLLHHYGRFTSPPGRKFIDGMVATVDPVELDNFSTNQVKFILTNSLGYDENSSTFLYLKKPNCSLDSGVVPLADAI